ncbi:hypothetical protein D3C85_1154000 [compost metagenome]
MVHRPPVSNTAPAETATPVGRSAGASTGVSSLRPLAFHCLMRLPARIRPPAALMPALMSTWGAYKTTVAPGVARKA